MKSESELKNVQERKEDQLFVSIPAIPIRPLLFFITLLLFLWIGVPAFSSHFLSWFIGAVLLFLCIRRMHPWDPLAAFFLGWGIVFLNAFSGLSQYMIFGSFQTPILFIVLGLFLFVFGYSLASPETKIDMNKGQQKLDEMYENPKLIRIGNICAYSSILSFLFLFFDLFFIRHLNPMKTGELREAVLTMESAGIFAILSSFLSAGGFFCIICFFFISGKSVLYLLGSICFAVESFFSAGRQMLFMSIFLGIFCIFSKKEFKKPIKIPVSLKILLIGFCAFAFVYLLFLTHTRDLAENSTISMSTRFAIDNNMTFSSDYQFFLDYAPQEYGDLLTNGFVYFANQVPAFCERFNLEPFPLLNGRFLHYFTPFLERQVDKIFPPNTYEQFKRNTIPEGYISISTWKTTYYDGLWAFGYLGFPFFMFFYGMVSKKVLIYTLQNISFFNINLAFINTLLPFYMQMYWGWGEQYFFFYSVVVLYLCFREGKKQST